MNRREFMNFVGFGMLAASLPVAIAACTPETTTDTAATDTADTAATDEATPEGFTAVGTVADLDANGFLTQKGLAAGAVIVVRDPANSDSVIALNSKCTHQGCTVDWEETEFSCACHGSKFATDGTATVGPAVRPLETYEATIEGDTVLVEAV